MEDDYYHNMVGEIQFLVKGKKY